MSGFSGADVAQLRALSSRINTQSEKLREIAASSTVALMAAEWTGNDIDAVRNNWRRGSLPTINTLAGALREMSAELDKHAAEQERVSGGSSGAGSWLDSIRDLIGNWFEKFLHPIIPPIFGSGDPKGGNGTDEGGALDPSRQEPEPPAEAAQGREPRPGDPTGALPSMDRSDYDAWLQSGGTRTKVVDNCTSWVEFRRQTFDPPLSVPYGNGGAMATNANGSPNNPPTLGAIVSMPGDPGHVMIVEEVRADGSFRVSEMNTNRPHAEDGDYNPDLGYVRQDRVWRPNGDGTYTVDAGTDLRRTPTVLTIAP